MLKILILYNIYRMEYEIKICRVFFFYNRNKTKSFKIFHIIVSLTWIYILKIIKESIFLRPIIY